MTAQQAPLQSWRDRPALVAARQRLAEARASVQKLADLAANADAQLVAATKHRKETHIGTLVGRATAADLKKAEAAREAREQDAAIATDKRDTCVAIIAALESELPRLEQEAQAEAFQQQRQAYLANVAAVAETAAQLADLQTSLKAQRDHLEVEYWFVPEGDGQTIYDADGCAVGRTGDSPQGRVRFPNGSDASALGLGMAFRDVTLDRVAQFKARAKQHGAAV